MSAFASSWHGLLVDPEDGSVIFLRTTRHYNPKERTFFRVLYSLLYRQVFYRTRKHNSCFARFFNEFCRGIRNSFKIQKALSLVPWGYRYIGIDFCIEFYIVLWFLFLSCGSSDWLEKQKSCRNIPRFGSHVECSTLETPTFVEVSLRHLYS